MSVIVELAIFPVDKGQGGSVSAQVARAVRIIRESGLPHSFGPMGTCIEGGYDEVMAVVRACFMDLERDCARIYFTIKGDYRRDRENGLTGKLASVNNRIGG
ncbi:MAG: MTH1187 family thiamine-binding protein [Desulfovibrionaceae bacterium]|jgi:uncharacterized protein (TIGR00106 family)|nr:MTH1187 family thiamine-binding protein [Desulfovibrionaceae bacterium]